jgi:hypothetical protein
LGVEFWAGIIGATIMAGLSAFMFVIEDGTKTAVSLILAATFFAASIHRYRLVRLAQGLQRHPDLSGIYEARPRD